MKLFLDAVREGRIIIFDGGMGTQLDARGLHPGPELNVKAPDAVGDVHLSYVEAGADVILTNTIVANRLALARSDEADKVEDYNAAGVRLCKEAAAGRAYVAGDIGSTGQLLAPYGDYSEEEFAEVFTEQAKVLAGGGVDLFIIETMTDPNEAVIAIKACKSISSIPVIASIAFDRTANGPMTMMGNDPESCARMMVAAGADIVGANCGGVTPEDMAGIIARMRAVITLPLVAQPNAGLPELVDGRAEFRMSPEDFAEGTMQCVESGAQLIGGCCGTTPAHIAALARSRGEG